MKKSKTNRLLSAVLAILMVVTMFPVTAFAAEEQVTYERVTEAPEDWTGEYLLVYEAGSKAFNGALDVPDAVNNYVDVTVSDGKISMADNSASITVEAVDGGYVIKTASGKYIYHSSDANKLSSTNNQSTAAKYPITFAVEADGTDIKLSVGAHMRFNANADQMRFRFYKSGSYKNQKAVALYKLVEEVVEPEVKEGIVSELHDGDKVVIFNPTNLKALSTSYSGYYNKGVDVTLTDGKLEGYTDEEIWTVGVNGDGSYTFSTSEGKKLSLGASYTSMPLDDVNPNWIVSEAATADCFYIKNAARGNYVEFQPNYGTWSAYTSINDEALFAQQFYLVADETEPEDPVDPPVDPEPEEPKGPVKAGDKVIIYNPANMKALSSTYNGYYNNGVDVTLAEGKLEGYTDAEIWTVGVNEDGSYTFSTADGKKLSLGASYSSMPLDDVNTDWNVLPAETADCFYIKNTVRGSYIEWYASKNNWSSYGSIGSNEALFAQQFYLVVEDSGEQPEDPKPEEPAGDKLTSADQFVSGTYVMVVSGGYAMSNLNGTWIEVVQPEIKDGKVVDAKNAIWTLTVEGSSVTITDINGATIKPKGGNNNGISSGDYDWAWSFNDANDTFTFKGTGSDTVTLASNASEDATYGGFHKFRAYKNTTVSKNPSQYPFEFTLYPYVEEVVENALPNEGDKVVIYNASAQGVLGAENDTQSISNVLAVIWEYEEGPSTVQPENGGVVFTVSKNGNYYRFYNEAYGYLCSNGTGNNAFYTQEASEDADWTLLRGKEGGFNLESRTAKYNGQYSQYLEYYNDSYKSYSMYNVTDYSIYEFYFYPLEEGVSTYKDVVHMPEVNFLSGDEAAYFGQDWVVEFELDSAFPLVEGTLEVEFGNQDEDSGEYSKILDAEVTGPVNGIYTITVPAAELAKVTGWPALVVSAEFEGEAKISHMLGSELIDEPSVGDVTPLANAQTGEDKRPVISAEIINAGEGATVTMTVNGETVVSAYDGSKVTYTPSSDMADGRTTVVVTVVRADGKETSKTWSFTVGESTYQLYFGQLHSHTTYSDGSGSLDSALSYIANLPESANVDFVAFTDHSNYFDASGAANPEDALYDTSLATSKSQELWAEYTGSIDEFNASQSDVVALGGFEMTWSGGPGHMNTFNTEGIVSRNNTTLNNKTNDAGMKAYYALLSREEGADSINQFNHPGSTFGTFSDFAYWDAVIDSRIQLVEVGNGEGQVGAGGYYPSYEYYTMALDKGWHVAPTNNQDNHKGKWGNANDARDVILTDDFSEAGLYQAIRDMRVYSTEDKNLEIGYTVNGLLLGSSITEVPEKLDINVTVYDPDRNDSISKVEVIVNSGKVAHVWDDPADLADGALSVELDPTYSYYYIRVTEGDGDLAVTAPVWVGESLKLGISSVVSGTSTPVTDEELTITTTLFNSENKPAQIKSITYTANGGEVIGTDNGNNVIPASGTLAVDFKWTPTVAKLTTVTVTAVVDLDGVEYVFTMDVELDVQDADKLVYIGIDASHYNEYVNGNYKDSMGNFGELAAEYGVRTVTLYESEDLIAACSNPKYKALILTAPSRRLAVAQSDPKVYTEAELEAIAAFNKAGGTVILAGWSDNYENYDVILSNPEIKHMAETQNDVLEALGSSLRIGDDATYDDVRSAADGVDKWRLYFNTYGDSFLTEGVEVDPEHPYDRLYTEVFSHYGGATVYTVDGTLPSTVSPVVFGHASTYSVDVDKDGLGGSDIPKYAYAEGDERLMVMATEQLEGQGLIIVSGAAFMSNFEVQATIEDSGSEKNYSNYKVCENLLDYIAPAAITPIAEVRAQKETGYKYTIEGIVTSNASGYDKDTAFFDCIYVQDETGGICCFPVAGNYKIGDKVRITGTTEFYQGEPELQVTAIELVSEDNSVEPTEVAPAQINDRSVEGMLVTVKGILVGYEYANDLIQTLYVKDYESDDVARVFIDGYITTGKEVENVVLYSDITVTGLASYDDTFNAPEGPFPRIRIRNREDVKISGERAIVRVTFSAEGESITKGFFFGAGISNVPTAEREGYNFLGWYDEDGVKLDSEYRLWRHTTFTARWEEKTNTDDGNDNNTANKAPTVIIDMNDKDEAEQNPETGAPVFAIIAVLAAAALSFKK